MTMKRFLAAALCLMLLTGCGAAEKPAPGTTEEPSTSAPAETAPTETPPAEPVNLGAFSAETLEGETLTQEFFANADLTLINLWGTYCGPCKAEMPVLGMLDKELENVQVLGIIIDATKQNGEVDPDQVAVAQTLMEAAEAEYPTLILNQELAKRGFGSMTAVPATVFVDSQGNLVGEGFYGALDEDNWRATIEQRLEMIP